MKRFIAGLKEHFFVFVLLGICALIVLGTIYSAFDCVFSRCNGDSEQCERISDGTMTGVLVCVCTNGSYWVWEKDPGAQTQTGGRRGLAH